MNAQETRLYGASDDLIEVEGSVREEFNAYDEGCTYVGFSDGTLASIVYGNDGMWAIRLIHSGHYGHIRRPARSEDGDPFPDGCPAYSDQLTVMGSVDWVVAGPHMVRASAKAVTQ